MPGGQRLELETVFTAETSSALYSFFFFLVAPTLGSLLPLLEHRAEFPHFLD
jgi:hypothetical protein